MPRGGSPKSKRQISEQEASLRKALRLISSKCSVNMNPQSAITATEVIQQIRLMADMALLGSPE